MKLTIEEFRNYKENLSSIIEQFNDNLESKNFLLFYLSIQNDLLSHDLSNIPFEEWKGIKIISDKNNIADFSKTKANIDLSIFDNISYINLEGCNIKEKYSREKLLLGNFKINIEDYSKEFINENKDLFLIDVNIPEKVKKDFFDRKLTIEDFLEYQEIFNKFPIDNFLISDIEISDVIKENYPLGEYQKIILKYQDFFKDISKRREMFLFNYYLSLEDNIEKSVIKAAKKLLLLELDKKSLDNISWYKSLNLKLVDDCDGIEKFNAYNYDSFSLNIETEKILDYFNIDYLKRIEKETAIFSKSDFKIFELLKEYILKEKINFNNNIKNYEDTEKEFILYLEKLRKDHYYKDKLDYVSITTNFYDKYPSLFIDKNSPEDLKELYNQGDLSVEQIYDNPEFIKYLKDKNLLNILNYINSYDLYFESDSNRFDFIKEYIDKYGNESFLKLCVTYGNFIPKIIKLKSKEDFFNKEILDKNIRKEIYKNITENNLYLSVSSYEKLENNLDFVNEYSDIFLNFNNFLSISLEEQKEIKSLCYNGKLKIEYINKYKELRDYISNKNLLVFFRKNKNLSNLLKYFDNFKFLELSEKYGRYLEVISEEDLIKLKNSSNLNLDIEKVIEKNILLGKFEYREDAPLFIKEKYPELFLNNNAPEDLKKYFYSVNHYLDFKILKENYNNWKDYLDENKIYIALIRNPELNNLYRSYFKEFGLKKGIKLGLKSPFTVTSIIEDSDIYLMKKWYEKTGETFVPDKYVIKNFPSEDIDKFLLSGKQWSSLARLNSYFQTEEKIISLIKASYLFGVFDQDRNGFDKLYYLLTNIPTVLSFNSKETLFNIKNSINNEYKEILEKTLKEENIKVDNANLFEYFYSLKEYGIYKINFKPRHCPKTSRILRTILENYDELPIMTPEKLEKIFKNFDYKNNEEFRNFFLKHFSSIIENSKYFELLSNVEKKFKEIKSYNNNRKLTLYNALSYISNEEYKNINYGNENLAKVSLLAGYSEKDFEVLQQIYNLGRKRTFSSIAKIEKQYNNYHYEILRLDDPFALTIGALTDSCQKLGGLGESCMEHSVVDKNGRIFVVKDKFNNIVAQSWVWRNKDTLCFDNIEVPLNAEKRYELENNNTEKLESEILEVYQEAAKDLIKIDEETYKKLLLNNYITQEEYEGLKLKKITVGKGYTDIREELCKKLDYIPKKDIVRPLKFTSSRKDYNLYINDSNEQYILEGTKESSDYKGDNLYVYSDGYIEYDNSNFEYFNTYKELEKQTKNKVSNIENSKNFVDSLANIHNFNPDNTRIVINPNFAILYEVNKDKLKIGDLLFIKQIENNDQVIDLEDSVLLQINLALKQIANNKEIELINLDENQEKIYKKAMDLEIFKRKK